MTATGPERAAYAEDRVGASIGPAQRPTADGEGSEGTAGVRVGRGGSPRASD